MKTNQKDEGATNNATNQNKTSGLTEKASATPSKQNKDGLILPEAHITNSEAHTEELKHKDESSFSGKNHTPYNSTLAKNSKEEFPTAEKLNEHGKTILGSNHTDHAPKINPNHDIEATIGKATKDQSSTSGDSKSETK